MTATDVASVPGPDVVVAQPRVDSIRLPASARRDRDPGRSR
jgi:hypothetical protein